MEKRCEELESQNADLLVEQKLSDLLDWDSLSYHERERVIAYIAVVKGYVTA